MSKKAWSQSVGKTIKLTLILIEKDRTVNKDCDREDKS